MKYFVNKPYSLEKLKREYKEYYKTLHPLNGGNEDDFHTMSVEHQILSKEIKERLNERRRREEEENPFDPNTPPDKKLQLVNINGGVAVVGDYDTTYIYRREIKMHGGKFNRLTQRWECKTEEGIAEMRWWFKREPRERKKAIIDDSTLTLCNLAAMAENGQLYGTEKPVKVGRFNTYADFIANFGAQHYYTLLDIYNGIINVNDFKYLQYLAFDLITAFGFDIPKNEESTK